MLTVYQA